MPRRLALVRHFEEINTYIIFVSRILCYQNNIKPYWFTVYYQIEQESNQTTRRLLLDIIDLSH